MEYLDVLDEQGNPTGKIETREIIHRKGLIHSEVTGIIYTENGKILLQKRNRNKKTYAGSWSVTGGHTLAEENKEEAIIREIKEEINLDVKNKDIEEIITYYSARINDIIINNKFITIFLIKILKEDINKIIIQKDELEEIKFITVNDLERLIAKEENGYKFPQKMELVVEKLKKRCENNDNNI